MTLWALAVWALLLLSVVFWQLVPSAYRRYTWYVVRHKYFVWRAAWTLGVPWLGLLHDWSKLRPSEFGPYAQFFYGGPHLARSEYSPYVRNFFPGIVARECKEAVQARFDLAWLMHIHRNKHHWQHWILRLDSGQTQALPMPKRYVREMLADWRGAGRAITGQDNTPSWYAANRDKMVLHPDTRQRIEALLGLEAVPDSVVQ